MNAENWSKRLIVRFVLVFVGFIFRIYDKSFLD